MSDHHFKVSYETISHESAEQGCAEDSGWHDEYVPLEPDEWDIEEGLTPVDLAVNYMKSYYGCLEASCSGKLGSGAWWTAYTADEDIRTGEVTNYSFHPYGFTEEELNEINRRVKG